MSVGEKRGNMNYEKLLERNMMVKPKQLEAYEEQHKIFKGFQQAYPLDIFPEIEDWKAVDDALKEKGLSLDRVAASNMRHVITCLVEVVPQTNEPALPLKS